MASNWMQLDTDLEDKPEFLRVVELTDETEDVVLARIIRLWSWVHKATKTEVLPLSLEGLARKFGGSSDFWQALADDEVQWLAFDGDRIIIPGYEKRFGQGAKRRQEKAASSAKIRNRVDMKSTARGHEVDPMPLLEKERDRDKELRDTSNEVSIDRSVEIRQVFEHYRKHKPNAHRNPTSKSKEWRNIRERLQEGSTVEELCQAIDGCFANPWNQGQNPNGKPYNSLELITRNASKVQQFIDQRTTRGSPTPQKTNRPSGTYQGAAHDEGF